MFRKFTVLGRHFTRAIRSAVLVALAIAMAVPPIAFAQAIRRTDDLTRILGAGGAADLLEGLSTPQSKEDAVLTEQELADQLLGVEGKEEKVEEVKPRIAGGETLLVTATFDETPYADEESRDAALNLFDSDIYKARLLGRNTFLLEDNGLLKLPGLTEVPLAGLTEEEAGLRLMAEPMLAPLAI